MHAQLCSFCRAPQTMLSFFKPKAVPAASATPGAGKPVKGSIDHSVNGSLNGGFASGASVLGSHQQKPPAAQQAPTAKQQVPVPKRQHSPAPHSQRKQPQPKRLRTDASQSAAQVFCVYTATCVQC